MAAQSITVRDDEFVVLFLTGWAAMLQAVQGTNDRSTLSKLSTASAHYFSDDFLKYFAAKNVNRAPLIHWGYWIRYKAIDRMVGWFLKEVTGQKQILSLGAGFDTMYFRLKSSDQLDNCIYYEVDFPSLIERKSKVIQSNDELRTLSDAECYKMIGCDLTSLSDVQSCLNDATIGYDIPTLIIAEVVFTYIPPLHVNNLSQWLVKSFSKATLCVYEQIYPNDSFGQVMIKHFQSLSSPLLNIDDYPTPHSQCQRFRETGWPVVYHCDMNELYRSLSQDERQKIFEREPFDEYEGWHLKCSHYHLICCMNWSGPRIMAPLHEPSSSDVCQISPIDATCINDGVTLMRYGHGCVQLDDKTVLVHGGFGLSRTGATHGRLNDVTMITKCHANRWTAESLHVTGSGPGGIMYHTMTLISDKLYLIGGRYSPLVANRNMFELKHCKVTDGWSWEEKKLAGDGSGLMGRWRHSATPIDDRYIMIVGGLVSGGRVLDDILRIDTVTSFVTQLPGKLPGGRHSHTALRYGENVLIIGGLDDTLSPINDIIQISINNGNICHFPLSIPARYGMSSHMMSHDLAILVGGVSLEPLSPEIIYIDLKEKKLINKRVKMIGNEGSIETVPLLFGHTSQVMQDDVIVFGGGGNCFSFGTHFTKNLIEINND